MLASTEASLWEQLGAAPASHASGRADEIVDAVETVLAPGDFRPSDTGLSFAIRQHIDTCIDDLGLDANALMRTFHCSRSTLYRLFEEAGGVAHHIRARRLQRCLDELTKPDAAGRTAAEVATRWGFENPSHFNRIFRTQFGVAPSLVKRREVETASADRDHRTAAQIDEFHRWAALG